jgi:hypothetical protein
VLRTRVAPSIQLFVSAALWMTMLPCMASAQDTSVSKPAAQPPAAVPASTPTPAPPPAEKKPKKVWTNDELRSVKGGVSVVGDANKGSIPAKYGDAHSDSHKEPLHQQQVQNYRNQIQQLRKQIAAADKQIAQLKEFKGENTAPSGGINPNRGYNMVPVEEQVKQLADKKKQLQAKIEDVENEARKNGIEPGELR